MLLDGTPMVWRECGARLGMFKARLDKPAKCPHCGRRVRPPTSTKKAN